MRSAAARPRVEVLVLAGLGLAKLAIHLATNATYGFHRDELYYLASGRHPALGYVDYPPLTPMLARLSLDLFGPSVFWLRLFPALGRRDPGRAGRAVAAELGGGTFARLIAATAALASPILLAANWLFQTTTFDQPADLRPATPGDRAGGVRGALPRGSAASRSRPETTLPGLRLDGVVARRGRAPLLPKWLAPRLPPSRVKEMTRPG